MTTKTPFALLTSFVIKMATMFMKTSLLSGLVASVLLVSCAGTKSKDAASPVLAKQSERVPPKQVEAKPQAIDDLPKGDWVMAKYIQAIGGESAHQKITSRTTTCDMEMKEIGIEAKFTITQKTPNLFLTTVESEAMGAMSDGFDGNTAWEKSALSGISILTGAEKYESVKDGDIHFDIHWKHYYESAETLSKEQIGDKETYKVALKSPAGNDDFYFIDANTFHLLRKETIVTVEGQPSKMSFDFSDFRTVDGIVMPFYAKNETEGMNIVMKCDNVLHNNEIATTFFDLPSDVQAVLETDKESSKRDAIRQ